jgi:hypothetical protein
MGIHMLVLLDVVGLKALDYIRTIPRTVLGTLMVLAFVFVAQPAQAATTAVPQSTNDLGAFLGCPTLSWLEPLQGTSQDITGMIFGFVIVGSLAVMLLSGIALAFAQRREDRAQGAIVAIKNAGSGLGVVLIGIPLIALVIWGLATAFNPACR